MSTVDTARRSLRQRCSWRDTINITVHGGEDLFHTTTIPSADEIDALAKAANQNDPDALNALRVLLDEHPEIPQAVGDLYPAARNRLIHLVANGNAILAESMRRHADSMERDLLSDGTSLLEKMAARHIVLAWLQTQLIDSLAVKVPTKRTEARKRAAERQWHTALKDLDLVRNKLGPRQEGRKRRRRSASSAGFR
jgi:hypothetical protein